MCVCSWPALEKEWIHVELYRGLLEMQRKVETGERTVIGVNRFVIPPEEDFKPKFYAPDTSEVEQYLAEYKEFKEKRDRSQLKDALESLRQAAAETEDDLVPHVFAALEAEATFAEIVGVLRMVDGLEYDWAGEREYPF